jgi:hypothetical protein
MKSSPFAYLAGALKAVRSTARDTSRLHQVALHGEIERLRSAPLHNDPKCLVRYGYKSYSQCDEDGILAEIFSRIGVTNRQFAEFGIGDGLENNTLALLFQDWRGLWIDASTKHVSLIRAAYAPVIQAGRLRIVESFITAENIDGLIAGNSGGGEIDLLSVDVDGNDYHIFCAIKCIRPRVVVIEYNAKFAPPTEYCMQYDSGHYWQGGDCFGASLKFLELRLKQRGYSLVACSLTGANAFFVRSDLTADKFLEPFTAERHYQPARYHLTEIASGHPPSYETLTKSKSWGKL